MIGSMSEREGELIFPLAHGLAFARIDQIERDAIEMLLGERQRGQRFLRGMLAAERLEAVIVERLHAERGSVDPGGTVARELLRLDAGGVGFERDLDIVGNAPMAGDGLEDRVHCRRPHQRRRTAAKENAGDPAPRCERSEMSKLGEIGGQEPRLVDAAVPDMRIEVAIGAFGPAERPVHVDSEGLELTHPRCRPQPSTARKRAYDAIARSSAPAPSRRKSQYSRPARKSDRSRIRACRAAARRSRHRLCR